ncbi:(2Fe-2S)-binding protein [Kibdelosporangium persicum]|uniref:Xanthine dehydrogenase YagT iron-sulfur-binding subunit n=1 Tax=Kibdelosporangium persicum TaxID=2698649 RepID=A0ABX2F1Q4_9PSEU|nr:2Fe-2S iron-sulfur cluster-binding protein [Kibdelosporangium persicum]NRN65254.1 Xanthine dehydrogenase YagT iron-sulfur-binding subunit [Kibdelosporangium persicum]
MSEGTNRRTVLAGGLTVGAGLAVGSTLARTATAGTTPAPNTRRSVSLVVNGTRRRLEVDPRTSLLDALRDQVGLTGAKKGCDQGACGACTVLLNGRRVLSCLTLAVMHDGDEVTTVEGLASGDRRHPMQQAFMDLDGFQCGFCTSGQIVSAVGLLAEKPDLRRAEIPELMSGNLCRCAAYCNIRDAIATAAGLGEDG